MFYTGIDAELTRSIYQRIPILDNERTGESPWGISFLRMFDMANDSGSFENCETVGSLPLYEAELAHQFDHRWATYEGDEASLSSLQEKMNPHFLVKPRYWISTDEIDRRLENWNKGWLIGFRDVCRANDERTAIFSILPRRGVGHKMPLVFLKLHKRSTKPPAFWQT